MKREENKIHWLNDPYILSIIRKGVIFLIITTLIFIIIYLFSKPYIDMVGVWVHQKFGLWGIFLFAYCVDLFILPISVDILFTIAKNWNPFVLVSIISLASILGGSTAFFLGKYLVHRITFIEILTKKIQNKWKDIIIKYNIGIVIFAALTPMPFSVVSWIVGILGMNPMAYFLAALTRIPRMIIYYTFISGSISLISKFYIQV